MAEGVAVTGKVGDANAALGAIEDELDIPVTHVVMQARSVV